MKYKVGDKVEIKTWCKLVNEFGVDGDGDIDLPDRYWTEYMEQNYIPSDRIITIIEVDDINNYVSYIDEEGDENSIPPEMIKEKVSGNTDLFQKYFDRGLTYYGTLTSDPEKIAKQANKYAEECIKYVRL